jgi:DNA-binding IclR family transcriptional regulator
LYRDVLGPEIGRLAAGRREFWRELHPYMERLFYALGEAVDCAVLDGDYARFVDQDARRKRSASRTQLSLGLKAPATASSASRAARAKSRTPSS